MQTTYLEIKSSLIKGCIYNAEAQELTIIFNNEAMYTYQEVTAEDYDKFLAAESQGSHFAKNIKGKKPFFKLEDYINNEEPNDTTDTPDESR